MPPKRKRAAATRRATRQAAVVVPRPTTQTPVPIPTPAGQARRGRDQGARRRDDRAPPSDLVAPEITYHVPQQPPPPPPLRPHGASSPPASRLAGRPPALARPLPPSPPPPPPAAAPQRLCARAATWQHHQPPRADRNIDKVVLGNLCFRTWYPSQYGKEVLGDSTGNARTGGGGAHEGAGGKELGGKASSSSSSLSRRDQSMLERLYVCPSCFKYARELVAWRGHVRLCERRAHVPGTKIYVHPRGGRERGAAADDDDVKAARRRRGDGVPRLVDETPSAAAAAAEGEWSIWEVDGEKHGVSGRAALGVPPRPAARARTLRHARLTDGRVPQLFCQNLSLFAKLFLDNKSVFFDVTGFNYFLLVYTPPPPPHAAGGPGRRAAPPQITGFFSKEKMSWDNNNLACILVFPPWQRKGLGSLLMGASYEISRREGILGGPEKPISDLGRRGYRRFWSGEIARWLLAVDAEGAPAVVDVADVSRGTWIAPDDCLGVLRDMGVVEDAGVGPGKPAPSTAAAARKGAGEDADDEGGDAAREAARPPPRPRVRLDKEAVRRFAAAHGLALQPTCDARGFVDGYGRAPRAARSDGVAGDA